VSEKERVAVLYGGVSGEHEVSLRSGQAVCSALEKAGYTVVRIFIDKSGVWHLEETGPAVFLGPRGQLLQLDGGERGDGPAGKIDIVFPVLHGTQGEDGTVQGLLELVEVPYVGAGVLGAALAMDKITAKRLFREAGLPTVDFVVVTRNEIRARTDRVVARVESSIGYPCFVKPANLGSSVGVSKVRDKTGLVPALEIAGAYDRRVLVERAIDAREIEVSVLGNEEPLTSVPGEVVPGKEFYDYEAKYGECGSELLIPAPLDDPLAAEIQEMAVRAFKVLDLAGMARVDFLLDRHSLDIYVSEANTIPGFTEISMYPKLWEATNVGFSELVDALVRLGKERFEEKQQSLRAARHGC